MVEPPLSALTPLSSGAVYPAFRRPVPPAGPVTRALIAVAMVLASCGVAAAAGAAGAPRTRPVATDAAAHPVVGPTLADATGLEATLASVMRPTVVPGQARPPAPPPPPPLPPPHHHLAGHPVDIMFIGDSVANTTAAGLAPIASQFGGAIANEGIMGCGVVTDGPYNYFGTQYPQVLPQCVPWQSTWAAAVAKDEPDVAAIVVGRWELMDRFWQGHWTHVGDPAYDAYLVSLYDRAVAIASSHGAKVALLTSPYYLRGLRPDGGLWPEDDPARVDIMNGLFRQVAARHPGVVTLVDFGGKLSPGGHFAMTADGVQVRSDGVHLTPQAGPWLAPWLMPQLVAIGASA